MNNGYEELMVPKSFNGGMGAALGGGISTARLAAPTPPGSLSEAVARLRSAIEGNRETIAHTTQRLESSGLLRASEPRPAMGQTDEAKRPYTPESGIAQAILDLARQIEGNNSTLVDVMQRIDG